MEEKQIVVDDQSGTPLVDETVQRAAAAAEAKFNSLQWLREQVQKDLDEEREIRRKKRNQRKAQAESTGTSQTVHMRARNMRPGRNDPCPCGAEKDGKPVKYKKCCGK